jgi:hypothetical protein
MCQTWKLNSTIQLFKDVGFGEKSNRRVGGRGDKGGCGGGGGG